MPDDQSPDSPTPPAGIPATGAGAAAPPTRKELRQQAERSGKKGKSSAAWMITLSVVGLLVVGGVVALVATSGAKTASVQPAAPTTTTATTTPAGPSCPLTGAPAPNGTVPARPALGVKIGNYPGDRPSAGLNQADIVFEEPVEGAITRLVAVFQCQSPALVGDVRSAREPDAGIMSQLSNPLLAHAGGIDPVLSLLKSSPLTDLNILAGASSAVITQPGRVAPYAMFVSTTSLWALDPSDTTPPAPIFQYSKTPPAGYVAGSGTSVHIPFSSSSDVTWTWSPTASTYLRSYSGQPDLLIGGAQTAADNIVVMTVQTATGSWVENEEGGHEVLVTSTGTGPLVVLRDGVAYTGTWSRTSTTTPATLTATDGTPITLTPGNTWVELVPAGITVTTPGGPAAAGAAGSTTTSAP
jgi:hypothetical protein